MRKIVFLAGLVWMAGVCLAWAEDTYMVIDLSGGASATNYPVSYVIGVPPGGWTDEYKTRKLALRKILAGSCTIGSPTNELKRDNDETHHGVTLTKDFYIGVFEVTQEQWYRVMSNWPSYFNNVAYRDSRPVEQISYYDVRENPNNTAINPNWPQSSAVGSNSFMGRLRSKAGLFMLDLPTEAQWEYACRAGTVTALNSGYNLTNENVDSHVAEVGRYLSNGGSGYKQTGDTSVATAKVGSYLPNPWGLYDMHGNLWEWCLDWYETYSNTVENPTGPALGTARIRRGGSWYNNANGLRSANRGNDVPSYRLSYSQGFRVAMTIDPDTYMVIDLSGGTNAVNYPVSYLSDVPPGGWAEEYKTSKLVMRKIPASAYTMGSQSNELGRYGGEVQHQITLTKDFYIGVFEVTQEQWFRVMGTWPAWFTNPTYRASRPVEQIGYYDIRENTNNSAISPNWPQSSDVHADSFMGKLRVKTGLATLDLPTEAQWEYACRAGTLTALNSGYDLSSIQSDERMDEVGRYWYNGGALFSQNCDPSSGSALVGAYLENQWGLYDMHGGVWEWCLDWYDAYPEPSEDPAGAASGTRRVLRGGSWRTNARGCRSANRNYDIPLNRYDSYGFRLSCSSGPDEMVLVEGGTFVMQAVNDSGIPTGNARTTTVSSFYIGKYEVTWGEWQSIRSWAVTNGYDIAVGAGCATNHPAHTMTWYDMIKWCNAKSQMEGLMPAYYTNSSLDSANIYKTGQTNIANDQVNWSVTGYRLPTEAEWQFATIGGNQSQGYEYSGGVNVGDVAWYDGNSSGAACDYGSGRGTWPVGSKQANEIGLYDMSGNVWEWRWDWYAAFESTPVNNPHGPASGSYRVVQGGSWGHLSRACRVAYRGYNTPGIAIADDGFRLARSTTGEPDAPTNLYATAISTNQINLGWNCAATNETGFRIEHKMGESGNWAMVASEGVNATNHSDTGLSSGTLFFYRVAATNEVGMSAYSAEATAATFAVATVTLLGLTQTYNGFARTVTATTMPAGLSVSITYNSSGTAPVNVGNYAVTGVVTAVGYQGQETGTLNVAKAGQTIIFVPLGDQNLTNRIGLAASASSGLAVSFAVGAGPASISGGTNLTFSNTGIVSIVASHAGNTNWNPAPSITNTFNVTDKIVAGVTLVGLSQVYNGLARVVTATTDPAGLPVDITYNGQGWAPTNAGSYAVTGTVNDAEYQGRATGRLVVSKAAAGVYLDGLSQTYDGSARSMTATTMPAGLTVTITYNGHVWAPTNAGTYAVTGTVSDVNYAGLATGTLSVSKVGQTITFPPIANLGSTNRVGLEATASSGLPVGFGVVSGPGVISGGTNLSFTTWGAVLVEASQAGDVNWNAAPSVTNTVTVTNTPPVVCVATQQIFLANMGDMAVLNAECSSDIDGDPLFFSWREYYRNPHLNLIPIGDEDLGRLQLYFPAPGRYQYEVRVSDGQLQSSQTRTLTVYVPGLKGVVEMSSFDGAIAVPDALVEVYTSAEDASGHTNRVDAAVADSLGNYVLECVSPESVSVAKVYYWQVCRNGFVTSEVNDVMVSPDPGFDDDENNVSISRDMLPALAGKVLTTSGTGIQGVNVAILGVGGTPRVTTTSAAGTFQLASIPYGTWIIQFQKSGYRAEARDLCVGPGMGTVVVHQAAASGLCSLTGKVTLAGTDRAIAGATVTMGSQNATTKNDGSFSFQNIPEGYYVVLVSKAGYTTERYLAVELDPGMNRQDIPMSFDKKGPTVLGVVLDSTSGRPVWRAMVGVESTAGLLIRSAVSDRTGYFQLLDVPVGSNQTLRLSAPGYQSKRLQFTVANYYSMTATLDRASSWREPSGPDPEAPVAGVVTNFIALANMLGTVTLDGSPSTGDSLFYVWRENPDNLKLNLIPAGSETMAAFTISGFSKPGIYRFELQVKSGTRLSANTEAITVYVPGLAGNVHASPTDWVYGLVQATVRAYYRHEDAIVWRSTGYATSKTTENNPAGDFALTTITTGSYWMVARGQTGSGYMQFGPERRRVNGSSGAQRMPLNLSQPEYALYGRIMDTNGAGLENVRVVMTTGVRTETYRTTTGTNGEYRLYSVPGGSHPMMLVKDGYKSETVNVTISGNTEWEYALERNESGQLADLSGVIEADYQGIPLPVPQAEIVLGGGMMRTFTDGDGRYEFRNLPPGYYYGIVRKDGYRTKDMADSGFLYLAEGSNRQDRTMSFSGNGPVVRSVVVADSPEALEGVTLTVLPPDGATRKSKALKKLSSEGDESGVFQLDGLPEGEQRLRVELDSGITFTVTVYVAGTMEAVIEVPKEITRYVNWLGKFPTLGDTAMGADPDGDTWSNWEEFLADTVPTNPLSFLAPASGTMSNRMIRFLVPLSSTGRLYDVWSSSNLYQGIWHQRGTGRVGTGGDLYLSVSNLLWWEFLRTGAQLPE